MGDPFAAAAGETFHPSGQEAEAGIASFVALFEQQLQAETDPKLGAIVMTPAQQVGH